MPEVLVHFDDSCRAKLNMSYDDPDVALFLDHFHAKPGSKVLVVGAHDEGTANVMQDLGLEVYGVDLREYDKDLPPLNYTYIRSDFCNLPPDFTFIHAGTFDACVSLSCIEHMGMGAYKEGKVHPYYDVIAMRKIWEFLKPGGIAYITVPFGGYYLEMWPHWRVYNIESAVTRLIQDFKILNIVSISAGSFMIKDTREVKMGEILTPVEVNNHSGIPPHISTLLMLQKERVVRAAPNGR